MELYEAVLNHFYEETPRKIELYGVGVSSYTNENEVSFRKIEEELEKGTEINYHPISLTGEEGEEVEEMDMYSKEDYPENSLLMVPHPSGFFSDSVNVAKRYRRFLELTEDSELDGVVFIDYEEDLERWDSYTPSKLFDDIRRQQDGYADLLDIEWDDRLLLGRLK